MPIHHENYTGTIPDKILNKSKEIYKSLFCLSEHICLFKKTEELNALAIYDNNTLVHVLFYILSKNYVVVLNEVFNIEDGYIDHLSSYIFNNYKHINTIHLNNIYRKPGNCSFPFTTWSTSNDIIIELPEKSEDYLAGLGKKTKKTIRYYSNKLKKEFKDFSYNVQIKEDINPKIISRISELNRLRMKSLELTSVVDHDFESNIINLSRKYGVVGFIEVDGQLIAGVICYEIEDHSYGEIMAFDQAFKDYRIGTICAYLMVRTLVERGSSVFHMGIGENDYKYRLSGTRKPVYTFSVFRTKTHKLIGFIKHINKYNYVRKANNLFKRKVIEKVKHSLIKK